MMPTWRSQVCASRSCMNVQSDRGMSKASLPTPWKRAVRVRALEREVELHLGAVTVEHDGLQPGRLAVQLDGRVGHGLAVHAQDDGVIGGERQPGGEVRQVVELRHQAVPFRGGDLEAVGPDLAAVEQIRAAQSRRRGSGIAPAHVRRPTVSAGPVAAAPPTRQHREDRPHLHPCREPMPVRHSTSSGGHHPAMTMPTAGSAVAATSRREMTRG